VNEASRTAVAKTRKLLVDGGLKLGTSPLKTRREAPFQGIEITHDRMNSLRLLDAALRSE